GMPVPDAYRPSDALLRQPHGFEGFPYIQVDLETNYPPVVQRPDVCPTALYLGSALSPACTYDEGDDHRIACIHKALGFKFEVGPGAQPLAHRRRVSIGSVVDTSRREVLRPHRCDIGVKKLA